MSGNAAIYLNNSASTYPRPGEVYQAVVRYLNSIPHHPGRAGLDVPDADISMSCRMQIAQLLNVPDMSNIILNSGATESLNTIISGLLKCSAHVIITATEHNSVLRPLYRLERDRLIELTVLDCDADGYVNPEQFSRAIRKTTSMILVNHCSNVTGAIQDMKAISTIAHDAGAMLVVDGSQSAGLYSVDVMRDGIDAFVFAGHKFLYGLAGIGGFYLHPDISLPPLMVGGTGVRSQLLYQPSERPILYESGTPNMAGIAALNAGVQYVLKTGVTQMRRRIVSIVRQLYEILSQIPEVIVYAANLGGNSSMLSFNVRGIAPEETAYLLEQSFGILTRSGLHCAPLIHACIGSEPKGCVRVSPSVFTTEEQICRLGEAVQKIACMELCV